MRQSNIELLRIVSMLFIILEHILIMGTDFFDTPDNCLMSWSSNIIIGFTYIGVNLFVLITGWFAADFSWKRLLSLWLVCGFYELVGFLIAYCLGSIEWDVSALGNIVFPLSHSNYWFVKCYVILLLLLPIINAGLKCFDKKALINILILLSIIDLYFGWFQKLNNGYDVFHMIYIYIIGCYLKRHVDWNRLRSYRGRLFITWFVLSVLWGVLANINSVHVIPHWNGWAYNNPIVILSAVTFFALFNLFDIKQSKLINLFGSTVFSVFLIHTNRYIGKSMYDIVRKIVYMPEISSSLSLQLSVLVICSVIIFVLFSIIDIPRACVHRILLKKCERIINRFPKI